MKDRDIAVLNERVRRAEEFSQRLIQLHVDKLASDLGLVDIADHTPESLLPRLGNVGINFAIEVDNHLTTLQRGIGRDQELVLREIQTTYGLISDARNSASKAADTANDTISLADYTTKSELQGMYNDLYSIIYTFHPSTTTGINVTRNFTAYLHGAGTITRYQLYNSTRYPGQNSWQTSPAADDTTFYILNVPLDPFTRVKITYHYDPTFTLGEWNAIPEGEPVRQYPEGVRFATTATPIRWSRTDLNGIQYISKRQAAKDGISISHRIRACLCC